MKYKRLARKYKEALARREQELTDMIVDNKELKDEKEKIKREKREESEKLRAEITRLMDENHRYQRDIDRLHTVNTDLQASLSEAKHT